MITLLYILLTVVVLIVVVPWLSYSVAKLGAYGFLKGKELFNKETRDGKK